MPAEIQPLGFRMPLTVTVRSAELAAVNAETYNGAATTTSFQIIFAPPHDPPHQLSNLQE
jgi:hypothetical protein